MSEWSKKREVKKHYDRIARIYDRQYAEEQKIKINAILTRVCRDERDFILDAGCGTGLLFPMVAKAQFVTGIDISKKLLQKAKQYTKRFSSVHLICADSDWLPFQDSVFNLVFAITLLQNLPNPKATLEEIKRKSKSQAIIAVTVLKKEFTKEKFTKLLENVQLKILTMKTDDKLKDHIAICQTQ